MAAGSLDSHRMTHHSKSRERRWTWTDTATAGGEGGESQTYRLEFPKGGGNGVSSGKLPGEVRDTDDDARALLEEARAGHHYHLGGGKPPPPQMRKLLHVRTVAGPQWTPQEHRDVQE